ncbi:hypothetical protein [Pelagerythrobacter sp.]|uniref:hypothetical protein n=1 Tax=Pelagerythrobacter sp. TaxID=2800702 RepID=UPI0035AF61BE
MKKIVLDLGDALAWAEGDGDHAPLMAAVERYRTRGFSVVLAGGEPGEEDHWPAGLARAVSSLEARGLVCDAYSPRGVHISAHDLVIDDKVVTTSEFVEHEPEALAALLAQEEVVR